MILSGAVELITGKAMTLRPASIVGLSLDITLISFVHCPPVSLIDARSLTAGVGTAD